MKGNLVPNHENNLCKEPQEKCRCQIKRWKTTNAHKKKSRKRWQEHFSKILNITCVIPVNESLVEDLQARNDLENINLDPPNRKKVRNNLKRMNNDKAPGIDGVTAEMWKINIELSITELLNLLLKIWESETIPSNWKKSLISVLAKKGNLTICHNSRGISLLPTAIKLEEYSLIG